MYHFSKQKCGQLYFKIYILGIFPDKHRVMNFGKTDKLLFFPVQEKKGSTKGT